MEKRKLDLLTIKSHADAYEVATRIYNQLSEGESVTLSTITFEREGIHLLVTMFGRDKARFMESEAGDLVLWPNRKEANDAIRSNHNLGTAAAVVKIAPGLREYRGLTIHTNAHVAPGKAGRYTLFLADGGQRFFAYLIDVKNYVDAQPAQALEVAPAPVEPGVIAQEWTKISPNLYHYRGRVLYKNARIAYGNLGYMTFNIGNRAFKFRTLAEIKSFLDDNAGGLSPAPVIEPAPVVEPTPAPAAPAIGLGAIVSRISEQLDTAGEVVAIDGGRVQVRWLTCNGNHTWLKAGAIKIYVERTKREKLQAQIETAKRQAGRRGMTPAYTQFNRQEVKRLESMLGALAPAAPEPAPVELSPRRPQAPFEAALRALIEIMPHLRETGLSAAERVARRELITICTQIAVDDLGEDSLEPTPAQLPGDLGGK